MLAAGTLAATGCTAIVARRHWGFLCASAGLFLMVAVMLWKELTTNGQMLNWLWMFGISAWPCTSGK